MAIRSQVYRDPQLGMVHVTAKASNRRMIARWKSGELHVSVPTGLSVTEYNRVMDGWRQQLMSTKPQAAFYDGWYRQFELFDVEIVTDPSLADRIACGYVDRNPAHFRIRVGDALKYDNPEVEKTINSYLRHAPKPHFRKHIYEPAVEIVRELGLQNRVHSIRAGHGLRRMGTCSSTGVITLSYELGYLPEHLRRYIILHELAHLEHMNHSAAFHAHANMLMGGREAALEREFKAFRLPFTK